MSGVCRAWLVVAVVALCLSATVTSAMAEVEVHRQGEIRWVGGGVGEGDRTALEDAARGFGLKVVAALSSGSYVGAMRVTILGRDGEQLLSAEVDGPHFYADVPPGVYRVVVGVDGQERQDRVHLYRGRRAGVVLRFADQPAQPALSPRTPRASDRFDADAEAGISLYDLLPEAADSRVLTREEVIEPAVRTPAIELPERTR